MLPSHRPQTQLLRLHLEHLKPLAKRAALPDSAAAALDVVEHVRATLTSAVASLCAGVSAEIRALAQAKDAALQSEQAVRDDQLGEATAATDAALQAAVALGDVDAVAHADAIVRRVIAARHLVVSMPPAPQTPALRSVFARMAWLR
jgi:hypothetical protein